jgi:hypothetical protein
MISPDSSVPQRWVILHRRPRVDQQIELRLQAWSMSPPRIS